MAEQKKDESPKAEEKQFPSIDYETLLPKLPFDADGFVESFELVMDDDDAERCAQNKREIQAFFDKYGVVVIRNTLSDSALSKSISETYDYVEYFHPKFRRDDPSTWDNISSVSKKLGIIGDVVMSKQLALNRCNPRIVRAWQYALDDADIFCNVGRVGYMRPTRGEHGKAEWRTAEGHKWLHLDMDPLTRHCTTYAFHATEYHETVAVDAYAKVRAQGILGLVDCGADEGSFQCVPGFHRLHKEWVDASGTEAIAQKIHRHRYQFDSADPLHKFVTKCPIRRGSVLIWNAQLPHNNYPNDSARPRVVQYIRFAQRDDPAVSYIKLGQKNEGPWGRWNEHLVELDVSRDELGELGRKVYRVEEQERERAQQQQQNARNRSILSGCRIL